MSPTAAFGIARTHAAFRREVTTGSSHAHAFADTRIGVDEPVDGRITMDNDDQGPGSSDQEGGARRDREAVKLTRVTSGPDGWPTVAAGRATLCPHLGSALDAAAGPGIDRGSERLHPAVAQQIARAAAVPRDRPPAPAPCLQRRRSGVSQSVEKPAFARAARRAARSVVPDFARLLVLAGVPVPAPA